MTVTMATVSLERRVDCYKLHFSNKKCHEINFKIISFICIYNKHETTTLPQRNLRNVVLSSKSLPLFTNLTAWRENKARCLANEKSSKTILSFLKSTLYTVFFILGRNTHFVSIINHFKKYEYLFFGIYVTSFGKSRPIISLNEGYGISRNLPNTITRKALGSVGPRSCAAGFVRIYTLYNY